jgi:hypothetical protein
MWRALQRGTSAQFHFNWKHVSAIAGLTRANFLFRLCDGAVKSAQIAEFLKALRAQLKRKLLIVRGGVARHRSLSRQNPLLANITATAFAIDAYPLPDVRPHANPDH